MNLSFEVPGKIIRLSKSPIVPANAAQGTDGEKTEQSENIAPESENHEAGTGSSKPDDEALQALQEEAQKAVQEADAEKQRYEMAAESLRHALAVLQTTVEELESKHESFLRDTETGVLNLAFQIARKVIHREVQLSHDIILYTVRELLQRAREATSICIICNPADLQAMQENDDFMIWLRQKQKKLSFRGEESIARSGCILETDFGKFDSTLETQLAEIEKQLFAE